MREIRRRPDQGARRPALPIRVRLRAVRVLPQREGHRVPRARRRGHRAAGCSTPAAAAAACRSRSPSTRARSSASIRSIASARPASRSARERGLTNLHFARADGMALPFSDGAFDLVLSHAVIEHVPDAPRYLRECRRVLAPERPLLSVDGAVSLVRRRASAAAAGAGAAAPDRRAAPSRSGRSGCWPAMRRGRCASRRTRTRSSATRGTASSSTTTCSRRSASRGCADRSPPPACASSARSCT